MEFFTIGVYNSTEEEFFEKLTRNRIDSFCDIRQRRGVRGSKYAFVNSNKLQGKLDLLGISYSHVRDLAPTPAIRAIQKQADQEKNELASERQQLAKPFAVEYKNKILSNFDFRRFFRDLEDNGAARVVLFCVEEHAEACHRSIVADELADSFHYKVTHL